MSRISKTIKELNKLNIKPDTTIENFMGGESYTLSPIETLKIVTASSIFGEPSYYRDNINDGIYKCETYNHNYLNEGAEDDILNDYRSKTTTEIMTSVIDNALSYDFTATLEWAVKLRHTFNMRLNPQVIMVRAAIHPLRGEWSKTHPGLFNHIQSKVMLRGDEPSTQLTYYLFINDGKKNNIPSILKRSIANKLSSLTQYEVNKYKNHEIGMINAVRLTHANSKPIDLLLNNKLVIDDDTEETWEQKRSRGMTWKEIFTTTNLGHMALLRNIKNFFIEVDDMDLCNEYLEKMKSGVRTGKQFPFRYYSAFKKISKAEDVKHKSLILSILEECIDIACDNIPKLNGVTVCLSDNSGSAWGAITSEYGSVEIAEIDNLSSVIAAKCSDEGTVIKFGDEYLEFPIMRQTVVLTQAKYISDNGYSDVGGDTEGGIWKYLNYIMTHKIKVDNLFIFSDMQAGYSGLYGTYADMFECREKGYSSCGGRFINVYKMIKDYRKKVNPKVNVFMVQTAGYDNVLIPEMSYRCAILTGWTGKEIQFASEYIKLWNEIENK